MRREAGHRIVASVLRVGVAAGGLLLLAGVLIGVFSGVTDAPPLRLTDLFTTGRPASARLELAGILMCAATPGAGVLALIGAWIYERDWRAVATAATVITILVVGMVIGHV